MAEFLKSLQSVGNATRAVSDTLSENPLITPETYQTFDEDETDDGNCLGVYKLDARVLIAESSSWPCQRLWEERRSRDVNECLSRTLKEQKDRENEQIIKRWLVCWTAQEIAQAVGLKAHQNVTASLEELQESFRGKNFAKVSFQDDFEIPIYNIWKQQEHSNKVKHFGNSEAHWLDNLLYLYTDVFDIVVDPFTGGGSTIDVCRHRGRPDTRYAAVYARVSTEDQADGYSLPSQVEACQKLAAQHGYLVPDHYIFREDCTGRILDWPLLPHVRALVRTRAVQAVCLYDPDRLARRFALQVMLEEEMDQAGVTLLYVNYTREDTPDGRAMGYMRGVFAEIDREKIMERTRRGQVYRAKAGNPWGGAVPLGYRAVREPHKARWEIETEEAGLVQRIFALCLSGLSTYTIALQLSHERVPTRGNGCRTLPPGIWQESTVHRLLTNEAYAGRHYWNKYQRTSKTTRRRRPRDEWIANPVPAIIDEATFQAVQQQLDRNRELSPRHTKHAYLLRGGRLRCGRCGRAMTGSTRTAGRCYYRCTSQFNVKAAELRCTGSLRADVVEREVWSTIVRV